MTEDQEPNSSDDDSFDDSNHEALGDDERPVIKVLPKSKGLQKMLNTRFVEFTRQGKHEHRNELVALLD